MTAIWSRDGDEWSLLPPIGFPDEKTLHTLVEEAPQLLPLAGDPPLVVVGREVRLGSGYADLIAVEPTGRVVIIEVKLAENSDARRAVVAQVLAYAAVLHGMSSDAFERDVLHKHLGGASLADTVQGSEQVLEFDAGTFQAGLASSLRTGGFRLVLVLDSAPSELVRLVGYLESMTAGLVIDLVVVAAYDVAGKTVMVPQRVDPERETSDSSGGAASSGAASATFYEPDGGRNFEKELEEADAERRLLLERLIEWARDLEADRLATVYSYRGTHHATLLPRLVGDEVGPFTIYGKGYVSAFKSVLGRHSPRTLAALEERLGRAVGQGTRVEPLDDEMLRLMRSAFQEAGATRGGSSGAASQTGSARSDSES